MARKHEKPHLVQVWQLAETTASGSQLDTFQPWAAHPCGRALLARSVFLKINQFIEVLQIRDVYPGSEFFYPGPGSRVK